MSATGAPSAGATAPTPHPPDVLLDVRSLRKYFPIEKGLFKRVVGQVRAVDDVSFAIRRGETMGLVGESGCGKTTLGRCLLRAILPTSGQVLFNDGSGSLQDIVAMDRRSLRAARRGMQMIFQDPYSSLDARMTVLDIVGEPLRGYGIATGRELEERVRALVEVVGLNVMHLKRYPHAFSGGQRQRIGIARALATEPRFIVADEPVSALDVSVQAQIINLLVQLQAEYHLTYLFIAHDLSVVEHISDRVAVMYIGRIVELAETEELFLGPLHPYTEALLSAVPKPNPRVKTERIVLPGEVPSPANPPPGCHFHTRCRYAQARCRSEVPALRGLRPGHEVACHFAGALRLKGVPA